MGLALREARQNALAGETPVGAIVVSPTGKILAAGANRVIRDRDPTAHAEIVAIRKAASVLGDERLIGCALAVTLEPCLMCAAAIREARLSGVVFGCADAREGAIISRADYIDLTGASGHIWHLGGVLAESCAAVLKDFFAARRGDSARSRRG